MLPKQLGGKWFTHSKNDEHFAAIRCEVCQNLMRAKPGKTVTCGRDSKSYTAPDSFCGLSPLVTLKELREKRNTRITEIKEHKNWQEEQGIGVTQKLWRRRVFEMEKCRKQLTQRTKSLNGS